ncbi:MAG TPA: hypothetical protein VGJ15_01010, partial [Pirellulales bacterium]
MTSDDSTSLIDRTPSAVGSTFAPNEIGFEIGSANVSPAAHVVRDSSESYPKCLSALAISRIVGGTLVVCTAALLIALAWPMFSGRVYVADDLGDFHLPLRAFYSQQLQRGQPFDWCPDLFCGFYLTGEGQAGTYHPLHWLLY